LITLLLLHNQSNEELKYHTIRTVPKFNRNIIERDKIDILTQIYMTVYFPGLVQTLQYKKVVVLN